MKYTKKKEFYRQLVLLTMPISLTSLIAFGAGLADTLMMGALSEMHLSAVALANQPGFVFTLFISGLSGGASVMVAQYWGKGDVTSIHRILTTMYRALILGGLLFTLTALFFSVQLMGIFTADLRVIEEGARFLRIICFSFLAIGISGASLVILRSVGAVRIALYVSVISLSAKAFLNWVFIFGNLGALKMEIEGAAIASVVSRLIEFILVAAYILKIDKKIQFRLKYLFLPKVELLREYVRHGGPVFINEFVWGIGAAMLAVIIGRMGMEFTAANSITVTLGHFVTIVNFSIAGAASVIIGNTVGSGQYDKARAYGNMLTIISIGTGLVSFGLMQILKYPMLNLYNVSELTLRYSRQFIDIFSVIVIVQSIVCMIIVGMQRGGGDTRFAMVIDVIFMWTLSIPLGFLGGLRWGWAAPLVFFVLKGDEILKMAFCLYRIKSGKWIIDVTASA